MNNGNGYQLVPDSLTITNGTPLAYFGSRRLWTPDRVGSQGRFFPYGEDRTGMNYPQSGQYAFATYLDNGSGVYYADQRWYSAAPGRFLSPDPYTAASAGPKEPGSWNRYSYTRRDPVNRFDPYGLQDCDPENPEDCQPPPYPDPDPCPEPLPASACQVPPVPPPPPPPDCQDSFPISWITFVESNYTASNSLGNLAYLPGPWILGWASLESGWGLNKLARVNNNYFRWRGRGNTRCPKGAQAWLFQLGSGRPVLHQQLLPI